MHRDIEAISTELCEGTKLPHWVWFYTPLALLAWSFVIYNFCGGHLFLWLVKKLYSE
jgi:hypothetical protein